MEPYQKLATYSVTNLNLNKYKKIRITPCILSDHHGLKLEVHSNTISRKHTNTWKLNNAQLNHQYVKEEIKGEIKDYLKFNENDHTTPKFMGHNESSVKKNVHSTKCLHKEAGKNPSFFLVN